MCMKHRCLLILLLLALWVPVGFALTPAILPFQVDLIEVPFPGAPALHSFAAAQFNGKWLFIGGRTNGIHSFDPLPINNFPPSQANHWSWVVDPGQSRAVSVDLYDQNITPPLGLIADALSSNNTQSFQEGN